MTVLDSSALLAWLQDERGADLVDETIKRGAVMHAVNWAEVLTKLVSKGVSAAETTRLLSENGILGQLLVIDVGVIADAELAAELWTETKTGGLSLGDRYCLSLGRRLGISVLTADRAWQDVDVGVTVDLLRSSEGQ